MKPNEIELLKNCELSQLENLMVRLAYAVWRKIDWDVPLWRSAGKMIYQRFESRLRATAHQPDLVSWTYALARKCQTPSSAIDLELIAEARRLHPTTQLAGLRTLQQQPGLIVAGIRVLVDEKKSRRTAVAEMENH